MYLHAIITNFSSISRNMKVQENNDSKRIYRHQFGNINDCPARNSASIV